MSTFGLAAMRRLGRCQSGTVAIEFAIVAPLLILLVAVTCETAAFSLFQFQLQFATEYAARQIRTNKVGPISSTATANQMSISEFKQAICTKFSPTDCERVIWVDVRSGDTFDSLRGAMPNPPQNVGPAAPAGSYAETFDPGSTGKAGSLIVTYDWTLVFPGLSSMFGNVSTFPGIRRLYGVAVFRNESS